MHNVSTLCGWGIIITLMTDLVLFSDAFTLARKIMLIINNSDNSNYSNDQMIRPKRLNDHMTND